MPVQHFFALSNRVAVEPLNQFDGYILASPLAYHPTDAKPDASVTT